MIRRAAEAWRAAATRLQAILGGPTRTRIVLLLTAVLALNSADLGAIGAVAAQLQADLGINHTELGLLATVSSGAGALASVPIGALADRVARVRLLIGTIVIWSLALAVGGAARSYPWLLLSRLGLGATAAAVGPLFASLLGDLFPAAERARLLGWILTGEMIGAGAGLLVGGNIGAVLSWRYVFWLMAVLGVGLAIAVYRRLPEPARGGRSRLHRGATEVPYARRVRLFAGTGGPSDTRSTLRRPPTVPFFQAMVHVLRIRTVRVLIVASALGYFFFAGVRTFGLVFVEGRFGIGTGAITAFLPVIGAGALAGAVLGGRLADGLRSRGQRTARIVVPAAAYSSAAIFFAPALLMTNVWVALPFFTAAAALLAAANPPLDAARLDLVPARLWGRAESVRTVLRLGAEAVAPLCFGVVADLLGGSGGRNSTAGLRYAFLIMLVPLVANGLVVLAGRSSYPDDIRAAEDETGPGGPDAAPRTAPN
jgi:predicted MFS family arabinose efflux permease